MNSSIGGVTTSILAAAKTGFAASPLPYSTGAFEGAFRLGDFDRAFVWREPARRALFRVPPTPAPQ